LRPESAGHVFRGYTAHRQPCGGIASPLGVDFTHPPEVVSVLQRPAPVSDGSVAANPRPIRGFIPKLAPGKRQLGKTMIALLL